MINHLDERYKNGRLNHGKKIFWQDPYQTMLDTRVKTVDGPRVTLEETIFYAFSGGQESDVGTIGGVPVQEARKEEKEIYYTLPDEHGLKPGDPVTVTIDWDRRYNLMRLHFAAEIVLEVMYQQYPGLLKVGAHIASEKARIDFVWKESIAPLLPLLQEKAQSIIDSHQDITSAFSDEQNERRYWKIKEFAEVPCGGTHLKNTKEVGVLRLKRVNPGKGKERIEIFVE